MHGHLQDRNIRRGSVFLIYRDLFQQIQRVHAINYLAKHRVLGVEVRVLFVCD